MVQIETAPSSAGTPMSISQWVKLSEDEPGELIDGQLVVMDLDELWAEVERLGPEAPADDSQ